VIINMPYIGRVLSVNYYKVYDRRGVPTNTTKSVTQDWMDTLTRLIREHPEFESVHHKDVTIKLTGHFKDQRYPDLHNLHKIIGDAVEPAIEVNDKYIKFEDVGSFIGARVPILKIEIVPDNKI